MNKEQLSGLRAEFLIEQLNKAVYRKDGKFDYMAGVMESVLGSILGDLERTNPEYAQMYKDRLVNAVTKWYKV